MNFAEIFSRAREMQEKANELQNSLTGIEIEGQAGGGLVRVTLSGKGEMKNLIVDSSLLKPDEVEILRDLIIAAHADAKAKVEARVNAEMAELAGKLGLPPGLGG